MTSMFVGCIGLYLLYGQGFLQSHLPRTSTLHSTTSHQDWCPSCNDTELCSNKFLFIVGTGRSGSTTLMNMVNLVPHVYLYGENGMMFEPMTLDPNSLYYLSRKDFSPRVPGRDGAWLHPPPEVADRRSRIGFQSYMWTWLEPPATPGRTVTIRGFKEIRWTAITLKTILHVCPCSRFISNFRLDLEAQHKSGWWVNQPINHLRFRTERLLEMMQNLSAPTFEMPLEFFSVEKFNKLASWLGSNCTFTSVAHSDAAPGTQTEESLKQASCE